MIENAVITAGGIGKRLLPVTAAVPKELLPLPDFNHNEHVLKPAIEIIMEYLYDHGVRNFVIVTGRNGYATKRFFENVPDMREENEHMELFASIIDNSSIKFVEQKERRGFGDAVMHAKKYVGGDFIVHACDLFVIGEDYISMLYNVRKMYGGSAILYARMDENPKRHGFLVTEKMDNDIYRVEDAFEHLEGHSFTSMGINPVYIFNEDIFDAIKETKPDMNGEIQLTDAIGLLAKSNDVYAFLMREGRRVDTGTHKKYIEAIKSGDRGYER